MKKDEIIKKIKELEERQETLIDQQGRILTIVEEFKHLDLRKSLLNRDDYKLTELEQNKIVVDKIDNILMTVKTLKALNTIQRECMIDYLCKKSKCSKTDIKNFIYISDRFLGLLTENVVISK